MVLGGKKCRLLRGGPGVAQGLGVTVVHAVWVADKGYDAAEFVQALTDMKVLPHVAQNTSNRKSAVPDPIAASDAYVISQQKLELIEQGSGWV